MGAVVEWQFRRNVSRLPNARDGAAIEVERYYQQSRQAYAEAMAEALEAETFSQRLHARADHCDELANQQHPASTHRIAFGLAGLAAAALTLGLEVMLFQYLGLTLPLALAGGTISTAMVTLLSWRAKQWLPDPATRNLGIAMLVILGILAIALVSILAPARATEVIEPQLQQARNTVTFMETVAIPESASDQLKLEAARAEIPRLEADKGTSTRVIALLMMLAIGLEAACTSFSAALISAALASRLRRKARLEEDAAQEARTRAESEATTLGAELAEVAARHRQPIQIVDTILSDRMQALSQRSVGRQPVIPRTGTLASPVEALASPAEGNRPAGDDRPIPMSLDIPRVAATWDGRWA